MPTKISAVFDLENKTITLSGLTPEPIIKYISDETNQIQYIEFVIDEQKKWVFTWKQFNHKDQQFMLQQNVPFTITDKIFHPHKYDPWSTLAIWFYTAHPSPYTTQTNKIRYSGNPLFKNNYHLTMEVRGYPAVANWTTN